jgi:hypothetical protein
MNKDEALKLTLEFANDIQRGKYKGNAETIINVIKAALETKDEPVLYGCKFNKGNRIDTFNSKSRAESYVEGALRNGADVSLIALYTTPPQQEAKDEPVAWKWHQAPIKTSWGDEMVVADLAIDKDNTVSIYCERDQTAKVEAMFTSPQRKPLTDEEIKKCWDSAGYTGIIPKGFARAIEAAHGIKGEA